LTTERDEGEPGLEPARAAVAEKAVTAPPQTTELPAEDGLETGPATIAESQGVAVADGSIAEGAATTTVSTEGEATISRPLQALADLVHDLAIAVVVCVLLIAYVVQAFKVQGTSMSPELADGERILVNKFLYYFDNIERGDVVVFWYPEDPELSFIKRVVGLPGETVEIKKGVVYVNGRLVDEPYVAVKNADQRSYPPLRIRPGHYFVLGDNRRGSNDSRSWGLVPGRYIYGKAFVCIWPMAKMGAVH
jgi:signal peptidase I